ncbi:MAG: hypothetical protein U1E06_00995 [Tabrizicola sp.]|uniref:hypothetical protein n=1 Tax=Tabrizicola sp. TaxID=2005166 RepID=UPI00273437A1|nr:hypothetical protein [Tabrizicola sp.]MDP3262255.1 hypothetical protein [Tabrizicola sp.]MDP3647998.1 hypothetical protein [Paracoccaceae bacterium]MDZ4065423.1 hypothetical protein [Tabrizicola sp.]
MLVKTILIFLLAMVIVAMIGKALFPGAMRRISPLRRKSSACARCGRPQIGKAPCECRARR